MLWPLLLHASLSLLASSAIPGIPHRESSHHCMCPWCFRFSPTPCFITLVSSKGIDSKVLPQMQTSGQFPSFTNPARPLPWAFTSVLPPLPLQFWHFCSPRVRHCFLQASKTYFYGVWTLTPQSLPRNWSYIIGNLSQTDKISLSTLRFGPIDSVPSDPVPPIFPRFLLLHVE